MNIKILKSVFVLSLGFGVANAGEYFIGLEGGLNHAKVKEEGVSIISKNNTIISVVQSFQEYKCAPQRFDVVGHINKKLKVWITLHTSYEFFLLNS